MSGFVTASAPTLIVPCCGPVEFHPSEKHRLQLEFAPEAMGKVGRLEVTSLTGNHAPQLFELNTISSPLDRYVIEGIDLNFDGVLDLGFGPSMGTPNNMLDYWLVTPGTDRLQPLGRFVNLTADPNTRELSTYEKGGSGGMLFESAKYRWEGGHLMLVESVSQTENFETQEFTRTTRRYSSGRLVEEKSVPGGGP